MRTPVILAALLALAAAAPAEARLVYVKGADTAQPVVYVARDGGRDPRRLGVGRAPTISPDGRWVAFIAVPDTPPATDSVVLQRLDGGSRRLAMRARGVDSVRFSPDSKLLAAITARKRVRVLNIAADRVRTAATGHIRGYSFSPDSERIVFGRATKVTLDAPSDLYVSTVAGGRPKRLTTVRNALYPVWGPEEIVFDRFRRRGADAPAFNLWAVDAAGEGEPRRLTRLRIPPLVSGLVPLELSGDGRRLLSVFTGQDTQLGFTVATRTGRTRALSTDFENGLIGFDLARDGRTILAHTGGPDPNAAHDVVAVPWGGGDPEILVEDAAYPDWSR